MMMRLFLFVAFILVAAGPSVCGPQGEQENSQDTKTTAYSPAEYKEYMKAAQSKNAEQRLAALDLFLAKYPHSGLLPFAYESFYSTYNELKNYPKVIESADRFLALPGKLDTVAQLRALAARTQAFELSYSETDANNQPRLQEARDAALRAIKLLDQISKPENVTADRSGQEKRVSRAFYEYAIGFANVELKDYKEAMQHLRFAASVYEKDRITFSRLGLASLRMNPPSYLDGFWALVRLEPALLFAALIFFACAVSARQNARPVYDSATVVTVSGTVQAVEKHDCSL